jgi:hypothetical protein
MISVKSVVVVMVVGTNPMELQSDSCLLTGDRPRKGPFGDVASFHCDKQPKIGVLFTRNFCELGNCKLPRPFFSLYRKETVPTSKDCHHMLPRQSVVHCGSEKEQNIERSRAPEKNKAQREAMGPLSIGKSRTTEDVPTSW